MTQGDPLSSWLFIVVIDWNLEDVNLDICYKLNSLPVPYMGFADDLTLFARSQLGSKEQVN